MRIQIRLTASRKFFFIKKYLKITTVASLYLLCSIFFLINSRYFYVWYCALDCRNPTPATSSLPKWHEAIQSQPSKYYRIGNLNFQGKPVIGMEYGGLFEDRAKFWRKLAAHLSSNYATKDELWNSIWIYPRKKIRFSLKIINLNL